ncbi:MAG: MFS transporter [bacterium]
MRRLSFFIHSLAHLINDSYGGFLAPLLPLLAANHNLSLTTAGLLVTTQTLSASLFQPLWGWLSDRHPSRWYILGGIFAAGLFFSLMGVAPNLFVLVIMIIVGGMGISCFHPMATALASNMTAKRKGLAIAFFITAGTAGYALGPVFISCLVECAGLYWMPLAALPALIVIILWHRFGPKDYSNLEIQEGVLRSKQRNAPVLNKPIVLLSATSIIRAMVMLVYVNFMSFYLQSFGLDLQTRSFYIFALQFGSSMGSLIGGGLSDRLGRWRVMFWTPLIGLPFLYLFLASQGFPALVFLFFAGFFVFASAPAVLVASQKIMFKREGLASALQIGFAWGTAGLLMGPAGRVGELLGIYQVLLLAGILPLIMCFLAIPLKKYRAQFEA